MSHPAKFRISILWKNSVVSKLRIHISAPPSTSLNQLILGKDVVPVYVWSTSQEDISTPALKQLDTQDFADHLNQRLESKPLVLAFTEENLSVEDFNDVQFPKLQSLGKSSEFIPAVQSPMKALKKVASNQSSLEDIPTRGSALVVIKLDDARPDEDRGQLLKRHDSRINEIYKEALKVRNDVLAVYTSHYKSWMEPEVHRVRRLLQEQNKDSPLTINVGPILLYASSVPTFKINNDDIPLEFVVATYDKSKDNVLSLNMNFKNASSKHNFKVVFNNVAGYWSLDNASYVESKQELKPDKSIVAPVGFSYHCTAGISLKNDDIELTFENFQVQAFMNNGTKFSDAYNCEMFFTAPIWSGLFVMAILAIIMIWGLVMIMDIRTMDQFDDPKGKTITINAAE
ncbi:hypothetical protein L9F63_011917 [Diploptera punctata]|uniref:V-type proton ATPase subunit S1 n=1 Tax=Diploptera punctata TaxID=6984 RepID=A0AAD8ADP3_DIPPU|nr:hypothetical protein L9F63_011917 [Diploptera punctata]